MLDMSQEEMGPKKCVCDETF